MLLGVAAAMSGELQVLVGAILYPLLGLLYFFPALFLYRYANRINGYLALPSQDNLDAAIEAQKSFWAFVGILTLVVLCLYGVALVAIVIGAVVAALSA